MRCLAFVTASKNEGLTKMVKPLFCFRSVRQDIVVRKMGKSG